MVPSDMLLWPGPLRSPTRPRPLILSVSVLAFHFLLHLALSSLMTVLLDGKQANDAVIRLLQVKPNNSLLQTSRITKCK